MSVRKYYPTRPYSIEEWKVILQALTVLDEEIQEGFKRGMSMSCDEELLETLLKEISNNVRIYEDLEPLQKW